MPAPDPSPAGRSGLRPWRSALAGWLAFAALAAVGVPLFLRMPLWCDATLYDVAARNVLTGGVHYRDVFDTNPPGFVWLLCGVRAVLGWSPEALRAVDLLVVAAVVVVLLRWAREAGASPAGVAWAAAGAAAFYLFLSEFNHVQRDVWMMLPALLAARLRLRRVAAARAVGTSDAGVFRSAAAEGVVWAVGFWIKPHVAFPAAAAWLVTARPLTATSRRPWRRLLADLGGVVAGGLLVGLAGVAWLVGTGTWGPFVDVFTNWNTSYLGMILGELGARVGQELFYFPPWSLCLVGAVPLAVANLVRPAGWWGRSPGSGRAGGVSPPVTTQAAGVTEDTGGLTPPARQETDGPGVDHPRPSGLSRAVLAGVFLGWAGTALVLQRAFHYAHVPEVLLMLAVFAANRWPVAFGVLLLQAVVTPAVVCVTGYAGWDVGGRGRPPYDAVVVPHPAADPARTGWWPGCFAAEVPRELRRGVGFQTDHFGGADPVELGPVEDYLRARGVGDGELICWHSASHPLYLGLGVRPGIRFMHLSTVTEISFWHYERVKEELARATPHARFAVSDLRRITTARHLLDRVGPDGLPLLLPRWQKDQFPFNQPVVFRSPGGRYLVHAIRQPAGPWDCKIPIGVNDPNPW